MIATWMLYAMVLGAFVIASAAALDRGVRAAGLPARYVWAGALGLALVLPVALPFVDVSPISSTGVTVGPAGATRLLETSASATMEAMTGDAIARIDLPLLVGWALISLLLLGKVVRATVLLRRKRGQWIEREIHGERVFVTPDLGPAVVAVPETRVIVPEWILSFDAASLETVVRHERQHRVAGDLRLIVASSVTAALIPWNPAVWYLRRRLRLALEMDCDARVLAEDPRVDRYGSLLLAIAQHPRLAPRLSATLTESTSDLERRIEAMTARPSRSPRLRAALFVTLAGVAMFAACNVPAPDATAPPEGVKMEAAPKAPKMSEAQGEQRAVGDPRNAPPAYPRQLRAARIEGSVIAKFVVDTNGRVDMRSFELVSSTHDAFTAAVRDHLSSVVFRPAQAGGRNVKQLVQMPFDFSLSRLDRRTVRPESLALAADSQVATEFPVAEARSRLAAENEKAQVFSEVAISDRSTQERVFPAPINPTTPVYPQKLLQANIQGTVIMRFTVRADGTVDPASMVPVRSDHDLFAHAVRDALARTRFEPKRDATGRPVDASMEMPFMFSMTR